MSSNEFWQTAYSEQEHRSQSWNRLEEELMRHLRMIERYLPECSVEQFNRLCNPDAKISTNTRGGTKRTTFLNRQFARPKQKCYLGGRKYCSVSNTPRFFYKKTYNDSNVNLLDEEETMTTAGIPTIRTEPYTTGSLDRPEDGGAERPHKCAAAFDRKSSGCLCTDGERVSVVSLDSDDLDCMQQLRELAETERAAKRRIRELEWKQELYMKTIQEGEKKAGRPRAGEVRDARPDVRMLAEVKRGYALSSKSVEG